MIHTGYRPLIVFAGDSITAFDWMAGVRTQITAAISALVQAKPAYSPGDLASQGMAFNPRIGAGAVYVNSGSGGWTAGDLNTNWQSRIGAYAPTILVLLIGINDVILGTAPATFETNYQSILDKTHNAFPLCQIVCCTLLVLGENWPSGANANDTTVEDLCSRIRAMATAGGYEIMDFRQTVYAVQEPIYNPAHAIANVLYDNTGPGGTGLHPNATGQGLMCTQFMSQVAIP